MEKGQHRVGVRCSWYSEALKGRLLMWQRLNVSGPRRESHTGRQVVTRLPIKGENRFAWPAWSWENGYAGHGCHKGFGISVQNV
jgi:hypothetical protein